MLLPAQQLQSTKGHQNFFSISSNTALQNIALEESSILDKNNRLLATNQHQYLCLAMTKKIESTCCSAIPCDYILRFRELYQHLGSRLSDFHLRIPTGQVNMRKCSRRSIERFQTKKPRKNPQRRLVAYCTFTEL